MVENKAQATSVGHRKGLEGGYTNIALLSGICELEFHIFIDRSVLEVFANETVCTTKVISPLGANAVLHIRADGGMADAKRVQVWPAKTIW
jgi:sucrose-6-phosphate hydrolase SacC (GH32 family)